jgi:hypothetical protein
VLSPEVAQGNISTTICVSGWAAMLHLPAIASLGERSEPGILEDIERIPDA